MLRALCHTAPAKMNNLIWDGRSIIMSDNKAALSAFREEVSAWMAENVPSDPGFLLPLTFLEVGTEQQLDFLREWQHKL